MSILAHPMSEQDIRNLLSGVVEQVNDLLEAFERRMLVEQQKTRDHIGTIRDGLRDDMDARFDVAFKEIDEIKAARDDLAAAVALVRGVQQELARLAAYLDRATPTRTARFSMAAVVLSILNLALLALHAYQMSGRSILTILGG